MLTVTLALLLASTSPSAPPMVEVGTAPSLESAPRQASLVAEVSAEPSASASSGLEVAGRVVMAPVLGTVIGGVGGLLGLVGGIGVGAVLGAGGWGSLGVGLLVSSVFSLVATPLGIAIGSALFSRDFKDLFSRSLPWAFLAVGVAVGLSIAVAFLLPAIAPVVSIASGILSAAAVPLIVEARRVAEVERGPEASVAVATF